MRLFFHASDPSVASRIPVGNRIGIHWTPLPDDTYFCVLEGPNAVNLGAAASDPAVTVFPSLMNPNPLSTKQVAALASIGAQEGHRCWDAVALAFAHKGHAMFDPDSG